MARPFHPQRGFTLIELVMVIVILGVVGGMVAVFMKSPIDAYLDSGRRAALTDVADTTMRRMGRDIRKSLPNSVIASAGSCVTFIPTKTGGRYRADDTAAGLDFSAADTTFNMLGSNAALSADQRIAAGDIIVVYNLGIAGASAYASNNTAVVSAIGTETGTPLETPVTFASKQFPLSSPNNRFYVVPAGEQVVSYVCSGGNLRRNVMTLAAAAPPASTCGVTGPIIARNVSNCVFDYSGSDLQRNALVRMSLQLTENGETVFLQHEVHINNTP